MSAENTLVVLLLPPVSLIDEVGPPEGPGDHSSSPAQGQCTSPGLGLHASPPEPSAAPGSTGNEV